LRSSISLRYPNEEGREADLDALHFLVRDATFRDTMLGLLFEPQHFRRRPMSRRSFALILALASPAALAQVTEKATFAAGCFWCSEEAFEKVKGVISVVSGYTGGSRENPSYKEVSAGTTGHTEAVEVEYDPAKVSYERLLETFWLNHDPTVKDRQFCDVGSQYRPSIFFHSAEQKRLAEASRTYWETNKPFKDPIVTPIVAATRFWSAEEYHQDFYKKNPVRYRVYTAGCGRYTRLDQLWGAQRKR
jgi:peptide-methionine (S)-S-oxide reductase